MGRKSEVIVTVCTGYLVGLELLHKTSSYAILEEEAAESGGWGCVEAERRFGAGAVHVLSKYYVSDRYRGNYAAHRAAVRKTRKESLKILKGAA